MYCSAIQLGVIVSDSSGLPHAGMNADVGSGEITSVKEATCDVLAAFLEIRRYQLLQQ